MGRQSYHDPLTGYTFYQVTSRRPFSGRENRAGRRIVCTGRSDAKAERLIEETGRDGELAELNGLNSEW